MAAGRLMGALLKAVAPLPFDLMAGKEGNKEEVRPGRVSVQLLIILFSCNAI